MSDSALVAESASPRASAVSSLGALLRRHEELRNYTLLVILGVIWITFQFLTDGIFLSQRNIVLLMLQTSITGLATISAVMLIVTRNFDLSVGSAVALVGVILAILTVQHHMSAALAVPLALAAGVAMGVWQGWWVTRLGVSSFIVTLAGMLYFRGLSEIMTDGETVAPVPSSLSDFAAGFLSKSYSFALILGVLGVYAVLRVRSARRARSLGLARSVARPIARALTPAVLGAAAAIYVADREGMPYLVVLLLLLALAAEITMRRTRFGAQLYAIGGNPEAARLAGIDIRRVVFRNFVIAGFAYGVTGIALTARVTGAVAGSAGLNLELDAIAAAIIGGTSLAGGRGSVFGGLLGALLMGSLNNGMSLMDVPSFYQQSARGAVLLLAVALDTLSRRRAA